MRHFLILLAFSFLDSGTLAEGLHAPPGGPSAQIARPQITAAEAPHCYDPEEPGPVTFQKLKEDIRQNHIASSEALLDYFGRTPRYQAFVNNPELLSHSGALHSNEVTPAFPRIRAANGNLILHLTANPALPGHNLVELTEFLPAEGRTRFSVIDFTRAGTPDMFIDDALHAPEATLRFHQLTLGGRSSFGDCAYCHGEGRPISALPGATTQAYGGPDDVIRAGSQEQRNFALFSRTLADPKAGALYRKLHIQTEVEPNGDIRFPARPNFHFARHAHAKDTWRMAKPILDSPEWPRLQYSVIGALFDCDDLPSFLPPVSRQQHADELVDFLSRRDQFDSYSTPGRRTGDPCSPARHPDLTSLPLDFEPHQRPRRQGVTPPDGTSFPPPPGLAENCSAGSAARDSA